MGADRDARSLAAIKKVLRAGLYTVKRMVGGGGACTWDVPKVRKGGQTTDVVENDVIFLEVALKKHVADQAFASGMVGLRDARQKDTLVVLRAKLAYAYL